MQAEAVVVFIRPRVLLDLVAQEAVAQEQSVALVLLQAEQ
jgi:hypothetical protein